MAEADHFKSLLKKVAAEQNFTNYDLDVIPILSDGAHYTSKVYKVTIKEGDNELKLFAKVAAIRKINSKLPQIYGIERFAYTTLTKVYEDLQQECDVPDMDRLKFAKFYACNPNESEETVVLEDLTAQGYKAFDRLKSMDWEQASAAVDELAKMHAVSFAYGLSDPKEFEGMVTNSLLQISAEEEKTMFVKKAYEKAIEKTRDENKAKLIRYLARSNTNVFSEYRKATRRMVVVHGDYRLSNLMYKKRDDGSIEIKIVDLQTLHASSPIVDLLYFIFTGSDQKFRGEHFDRLVEHYYTHLSGAMTRLRLQPEQVYSREDFYYELKEKLPLGLGIAIFMLPMLTVEATHALTPDEDMETSSFVAEHTSDLYTERLNGIVDDYVKWGILT